MTKKGFPICFPLVLATVVQSSAQPLNPLDYTSLGAFPTAPGAYVFNTSGVPVLTGPGVRIEGVVVDHIAVFTFNDIRVPPDMILTSVGSRPVALLSRGTVSVDGPINVLGGASGMGAGEDSHSSFGGGGGGGFGGAGANGWDSDSGISAYGGAPYGDIRVMLQGGSGGGAGSNWGGSPYWSGGEGGGALELGAVGSITIRGPGVHADGGSSPHPEICLADPTTDFGGGGGGSGGAILVHADSVALEGALSARGGNGSRGCGSGGQGGGGGGGRIAVIVGSGGFVNTGAITVTGGFLAGQVGQITLLQAPPTTDPQLGIAFPGTVFDAIVTGEPYTVAWSIDDPQRILTSAALSYSLDDGRTFTPLAGCENLPPRTGQCVWSNPGPVGDLVRLRLVATNSAQQFVYVSGRGSIVASPGGWTSADVGSVGAAGTTAYSNAGWTIEGSGADIWGTADEFRYVYRPISGNFSITARVASIENLDRWVKAGLMIRETLSAGSRHVSLLATPRTDRGVAFQRRRQTDGISVHTAGPAVAPPGWLTLGRVGDTIAAYYRASPTDAWTLVGRETIPGLPAAVLVGLAVTSHVDGTLATARFDNVSIETGQLEASQDVGAVGVPGSATFDGVVYDVRASGTDIWGTADSFRIVHHGPSSPGPSAEITARVRSVGNTSAWAKAGVMFRQSPLAAQSSHVTVVVTPGRGVAMHYRANPGAASVQVAVRAGTAPEWVRLAQVEGVFRGYASEDGVTWHLIGEISLDWTGSPVLAVTSHNNAVLTRAVLENVRLRQVLSR
jgi:hypothetical protein